MTDGPRKEQLFWDQVGPKFGPGADGSDWDAQDDFWYTGQPDGSSGENYATMDSSEKILDVSNARRQSISHHDLRVSDWTISARLVEVTESPPNPVLEVDFSKFQATAERPLILTEDHILVDDPDTRDADDNVDASKIKFRITNIAHGTLHERADTGTSTPWTEIVADGSNAYLEFTLAQLQGGLIAFFPDKGASTLTFDIQADDGTHLSDSDRSTSDSDRSTPTPDPESVSVPVVVLKKVVVGEEVRINDDGVLTPHDDTLDAWLAADDSLKIFVVLQGGKSGIFTPSAGVVHEHLSVGSSHGVASSEIAVSWDARNWRLVLLGTSTATRVNFQAMLGALRLQTVPFGQVSHRTISVQADTSDMSVAVARAGYYRRGVEVSASAPNPVLELDFDKSRADSSQRFVLMEKHILVYDPDTLDGDGNVDPSRISFRIMGLTGGTLKKLSSDDPPVWRDISPSGTGLNQYREFTLAELRAGKIAFLAGDGLASGGGKKIVFQVQAADNAGNLSDSDPDDGQGDADPVDGEIPVFLTIEATAGTRGLLNADRALTPDAATLTVWKQSASAHGGTLSLIVRLLDSRTGDVLSLQSGYDASKVTPRWNGPKGELTLEIAGSATTKEMETVLGQLEFNSALSSSANTRKVWVFPILSGVDNLAYRVDETAGLVRYYFYDSQDRSFSDASTAASGRIFFGKRGYLGVPISKEGKDIYRDLKVQAKKSYMHLAISDSVEEGKWLMTDGPRKGLLFWDHVWQSKYGPGAERFRLGCTRSDFWYTGQPDGGSGGNYARIGIYGGFADEDGNRNMSSISHHDLWLGDGETFARLVEVAESPPDPVLRFYSDKFQVTSQSPLILTEDHISLEDVDTRDPSDDTKVDGSRITFRVMGLAGGTLRARADAAGTWDAIVPKGTVGSEYQEFTLRQLREGLVSLLPGAAGMLTFEIQAGDGTNFSDSDPYDDQDDADPTSVSLRVVARKEIYAGKEMPVNDDRRTTGGDGALTPSDATLQEWMRAATGSLRVFVKLEGGKRGDMLFLEDGHGIDTITSSWSWDVDTAVGTLSLQSDGSATVDNFQAVLNALALRTVRSAGASVRTISVRPDIAEEVPQKDYYARDVLVPESGPKPYVGEQKTVLLQFGQDDRAILSPSEFLVEDFDTPASKVMIVVRKSTPTATLPTLQRNDGTGTYTSITPESDGSLEFKLEKLQQGLIAVYLSDPAGKKVEFDLEARDDDGNWNDIGKSNTYQKGARSFSFYGIQEPAPEDLEVDLQTGYQKAFPFKGLEGVIETARSDSSRDGALHIVLRNAVQGDLLVIRKSVSGITGGSVEGGHHYALTVSDGATTSEKIAEALGEIYYRARESLMGNTRQLVISWVDDTNAETVLFTTTLPNRPPVLRNWGMAARYHDVTPAPDATESPLDLGYHPYREYMPEILDNEGEVVRLEVVLVDKAGGVLSADERVFLPQELRDQAIVEGLVLREQRSSDDKARALVIEAADGKTPVSPEFMTQVLQGLMYLHGAAGRDGDVGERREISVAVFDGEVYSQTLTMEVRLVGTLPNPAGYVNTFIGTSRQSGMGVSSGTGNKDNEAGMTFPGAAYPFGAVRLTPFSGQGLAYGGYRHDKSIASMRFVVTAFSGPGCAAAGGGMFIVGASGAGASKGSQESEAGYYKVLLGGGVTLEAAASSPRIATVHLTYQWRSTGFLSLSGSVWVSERDDHWVVTYDTREAGVCSNVHDSIFYVSMHIGKHQVSGAWKSGSGVQFRLRGGQRAVDVKISMSYVSREGASRNIDVENPEWTDFEVEKDKARKAWNYYLSKVAIDEFQDSDHDKGNAGDKWSTFYSALYRSMLHMNTASDVDGNYMAIGRNPKNVREAPTYPYHAEGTEGPPPKVYFYNFSGWDVYRSQMALVGLMAPALSQDMAISLLETGYLGLNYLDRIIPRWTTGYQETAVMVGDPGPPSVSSLFMFGSRSVSLNSILSIFSGLRTTDPGAHHILEGAVSDGAIMQMALWISHQDSLPEEVRKKARGMYEYAWSRGDEGLKLLDSEGYAKPLKGSPGADPKSKHYHSFAEGNAIQYTFMITNHVLGLKKKIDDGETRGTVLWRGLISGPSGGSGAYKSLLDASKSEGLSRWDTGERSMALRFPMHFLKPNEGRDSWYSFMGNEVAHSSPFLANWFEPHLTQNAARRIALFGFRNTPGGLYGNDDLGSTSAWYVWTAMGMYPVMPGVGGVTLVAPMFRSVEISVPGGKSVSLRSSSGRAEDAYIQSVRRDGRETSSVWLTASELLRGVELDFRVGASRSTWGQDASDAPPSYGGTESKVPASYGSIWLDEGDDATGASSHSAFDGEQTTAWRFSSESDGSKELEVDFTSVYAASGLWLRFAEAGRPATFHHSALLSVWVKGSDDSWSDVAVTKTDDGSVMLLDFDAGEVEIHGLRLTFGRLDANEEHGIYEVLAKDGRVVEAARLRGRRSLLERSLDDGVSWTQLSPNPVLSVGGLHEQFQVTAGRILVLGESHISVEDLDTWVPETGDVDASRITLRVRGLAGGKLQRRASGSATTWTLMDRDDGSPVDAPVYSFSLADLRAGKIGFLAGDGTNPITFTIQAEDDDGNLSDSDSVRNRRATCKCSDTGCWSCEGGHW